MFFPLHTVTHKSGSGARDSFIYLRRRCRYLRRDRHGRNNGRTTHSWCQASGTSAQTSTALPTATQQAARSTPSRT